MKMKTEKIFVESSSYETMNVKSSSKQIGFWQFSIPQTHRLVCFHYVADVLQTTMRTVPTLAPFPISHRQTKLCLLWISCLLNLIEKKANPSRYQISITCFFFILRCRWVGKVDDCEANENHSRDGILAGGVRAISAGGLQQHNSESDGDYPGDGSAAYWLCRSTENGCGAAVLYIRVGGGRGRVDAGAGDFDEETVVGWRRAAMLLSLARISAQRLRRLLFKFPGSHCTTELRSHTTGRAEDAS